MSDLIIVPELTLKSSTEERNLVRCITCGTPWQIHSPECSRHAFRPINGHDRITTENPPEATE